MSNTLKVDKQHIPEIILLCVATIALLSPFSIQKNQHITITPNIAFAQEREEYCFFKGDERKCYSTQDECNDAEFEYSPTTITCAKTSYIEPDGWLLSDIISGFKDALNSIIVTIAWIPIAISGGILNLVGLGFDAAIDFTITDFGSLFKLVGAGVTAAWGTFRDMANIVMIAMFIFIAIATILNLQSYGLKQFGVRILLIALLLNFSLFFTKVIVDVSNTTAEQFLTMLKSNIQQPATQASGSALTKSESENVQVQVTGGVAGYIVQATGLSGLLSMDELNSFAKENRYGALFLYSLFVSIFFIATAAVLLFGLILLLTRAVMFIVLMITSALAFVAFMTPNMEGWWTKWWGALIRYALFAPVFMLMLLAVVKIVSGLKGGFKGFLENPDASKMELVFNFVIILGLLYAATKIASEMSIMGSKWAQKVSYGAFGKTLGVATLPFTKVGAFAARKAAGRGAEWARNKGQRFNFGPKFDQAMKRVQTSGMRFGDTKLAEAAKKASGIPLGFKSPTEDQQTAYDKARYDKGYGRVRKEEAEALQKQLSVAGAGTTPRDEAVRMLQMSPEEKRAEIDQERDGKQTLESNLRDVQARKQGLAPDSEEYRQAQAEESELGNAIRTADNKIRGLEVALHHSAEQQLAAAQAESGTEGAGQPAREGTPISNMKDLVNAIETFRDQERQYDLRGEQKEAQVARRYRQTLEGLRQDVQKRAVDKAYGTSPYMQARGEKLKKSLDPNAKRWDDLESKILKGIKDSASETKKSIGDISK
jgi:hypothetical protein